MSSEVTSALIAAIVGTISAFITLIIGLGQLRNDKRRLEDEIEVERQKLEHDRERLRLELQERAEQVLVWKAEIEKLRTETQKLSTEADDIRRRRLEAERLELKTLLILFERAAFDAPRQLEEPVAMFRALQQTRLSLQMSGASLVRDREIAEHFKEVREILLETEAEIKKRYPMVAQLAIEDELERLPSYERHRRVENLLGRDYWRAVEDMVSARNRIMQHVNAIRERLKRLDEGIG